MGVRFAQDFKVDGQAEIKEPIGMYGERLEANFHVVVGQVSSIRNIGRCIQTAGLGFQQCATFAFSQKVPSSSVLMVPFSMAVFLSVNCKPSLLFAALLCRPLNQ